MKAIFRLFSLLGLADALLQVINHLRDEFAWFREASGYGDTVYIVQTLERDPRISTGSLASKMQIYGVYLSEDAARTAVEKHAAGFPIRWDGPTGHDLPGILVQILERTIGDDHLIFAMKDHIDEWVEAEEEAARNLYRFLLDDDDDD